MGGDGGVVATNRRYMRGAGTADHTGDYYSHETQKKFNAVEAMTTCALTKTPLFNNDSNTSHADDTRNGNSSFAMIVTDPYGTLYHKEAAVQALLRRKQQRQQEHVNHNVFDHNIGSSTNSNNNREILGCHVRRLADLYEVRFHRENNVCTCPITGKSLNGSIPAIVLVPGKASTPNVVSQSALQQLSTDELDEEYGPIVKKIRLAPPPTVLEEIKKQVLEEQEREEEEQRMKKAEKAAAKKKKKRKHRDDAEGNERREKKQSNKD